MFVVAHLFYELPFRQLPERMDRARPRRASRARNISGCSSHLARLDGFQYRLFRRRKPQSLYEGIAWNRHMEAIVSLYIKDTELATQAQADVGELGMCWQDMSPTLLE